MGNKVINIKFSVVRKQFALSSAITLPNWNKQLWMQFLSFNLAWLDLLHSLVANACTSCVRGSGVKSHRRTVGVHPVLWYQLGRCDKSTNLVSKCQNYCCGHLSPQTKAVWQSTLHGLSSKGLLLLLLLILLDSCTFFFQQVFPMTWVTHCKWLTLTSM